VRGDNVYAMQLAGKNILVTGASGGLGTFVTESLLEAGAVVAGAARSISATDFPHERFHAMPAELSSADAANKLVDAVIAVLGRVDGLVHLVGGFAGGKPVAETDDATFDRMINLNLHSSLHIMRPVLRHMIAQGSGRVIAIGSKAALEPTPGAAVYAASKAALVSLVRTVARENAKHGITANILLPGTMDTPANRAADPNSDRSKWVDPRQVAQLIVHLVSADASNVNGAVIPVVGADA
jgi:NAD(P)-dependent dehydrogenase (short-subunit alcohol dehydrogenase family)